MKWKAPEFHFIERGSVWYTASIVVAILIVIFAALNGNFLFAFFVVIAEVLLLYWSRQEPGLIEYEFDKDGLSVGELFYPMKNLSSFSFVLDHPDDPYFELVFEPARATANYIKLLVPVDIVDDLYDVIDEHLEEFEYEEGAFEHIAKIIRL